MKVGGALIENASRSELLYAVGAFAADKQAQLPGPVLERTDEVGQVSLFRLGAYYDEAAVTSCH